MHPTKLAFNKYSQWPLRAGDDERWARKAACHGLNLSIRTLGYSYNAYVLIFD
jgi:hypothetical protein